MEEDPLMDEQTIHDYLGTLAKPMEDEIQLMILDNLVHADAAHIADLVLDGRTEEADAYSQKPEVQARIRRWKAAKR